MHLRAAAVAVAEEMFRPDGLFAEGAVCYCWANHGSLFSTFSGLWFD